MKIRVISYQKKYSIGPYLTDQVGFEASIEPNESEHEALKNLAFAADRFHKEQHPHLYQENTVSSVTIDNPGNGYTIPQKSNEHQVIDYGKQEEIEKAIDNANTPSRLKKVKEEYPVMNMAILKQYNARLAVLQAEWDKLMGHKNAQ